MNSDALDGLVTLAFDVTLCEASLAQWEQANTTLPIAGRQLESAKWGLPIAHLALTIDSMVDYDLHRFGGDLCGRFLTHLAKSKGRPVSVGHFVCDDDEILFLKGLRCIPSSFLFGPRNAIVDSNVLLGLIAPFRIKKHAQALDRLRIQRGPFYKTSRGFSEPSPADFDRFSAIGQISAEAVVGHDVDVRSRETHLFVVFLGIMQMLIDHRLKAAIGTGNGGGK